MIGFHLGCSFNLEKYNEGKVFIPSYAKLLIEQLLTSGKKKYPTDKWKEIPIKEHVAKAQGHIQQFLDGKDPDVDSPSHLINACVRLIFAIELNQLKGSSEDLIT